MESSRPTLVIADDHLAITAALSMRLEREGFQVIATVDHAGLAVAVCQLRQPSLCLLDIVMPGANAFEAVTQIQQVSPVTRILFYSGYGADTLIDRALASGSDGFVSKNEPFDHLVWSLRHVLAGHTYFSPRIAERLIQTAGVAPSSRLSTLTAREREVLHYLAQGHNPREIALALNVGVKTVEKDQHSMREKLQLSTAVQLARFAFREGLLAP